MQADELTHIDSSGQARMVDVSQKAATARKAIASGRILMSAQALRKVAAGEVAKGAVLSVARIAAIGALKRTSDIIPLCHPLPVDHASADFRILEGEGAIECTVGVALVAKTGPEMEAILGVLGGLAAIYDMCKAIDNSMEITGVRLLEKSGGKSGIWTADRGRE